jgi:hypothetical protein
VPGREEAGTHVLTTGWLTRYFSVRQIVWGASLIAAVGIGVLAALYLAPALRAANGEGTHGTWVAQRCVAARGSCTWSGEFLRADGTVVLAHARYTGDLTGVHPGWRTPALDSGASDEVYPAHGSTRWEHDVIGLAASFAAVVALLARAYAVRRRRRRGDLVSQYY